MTDTAAVMRAIGEVATGSAVLLDVRRDDEWEQAHAVGATHWPLARLQAGDMPSFPKHARIYTHCAAGGRAATACDLLRAQGYTDVTNIGGLIDWQRAGGPIE